MNLKTLIQEELWQEISKSYGAEDYKNAILEAIHYLTELIREKTAIDADGVNLVGQALGGKTPKLKINKLQTQSERDEQAGLINILNGIYMGVRNPRSHSQIADTKTTADQIIYFIDYLCIVIDKSKMSFSIESFLENLSDPNFVGNKHYVELLIDEIPALKKTDVLIEVFRIRNQAIRKNLTQISEEIINRLSETDADTFMSVFSEELKNCNDERELRSAIEFIPSNYWSKINERTKMRLENIIIQSIKDGKIDPKTQKPYTGVLGGWGAKIVRQFTLISDFSHVIQGKLIKQEVDEDAYVMKYFLFELPIIFTEKRIITIAVSSMHRLVEAGDSKIGRRLVKFLNSCPSDWKKEILLQFSDLTDPEHPEFLLDDSTPFLRKLPIEYDDIPF